MLRRAIPIVAIVLFLAALSVRVLGPSDLGQNVDQARTMSHTVDMVVNGRWFLPVDLSGKTTRKPPLVNWVAAPLVASGVWAEWAHKAPSLLGAIAAFAVAWAGAARLLPRVAGDLRPDAGELARSAPIAVGALAGAVWIASPTAIKHAYFCRPDMIFGGLLALGWYSAVRVADEPRARTRALWSLATWFVTGLALLAKGPWALLIPTYAALVMLIRPADHRPPWHAWIWGPAFAGALFAAWLVPAYLADPDFVANRLVGGEVLSRLGFDVPPPGPDEIDPYDTRVKTDDGGGGLGAYLSGMPQTLGWFVERFVPWSVPALAAFIFVRPWRWRAHPLAPAGIWVCLVIGITMLMPTRGASYLVPVYPVAAILAVYALLRVRSPLPPIGVAIFAAIVLTAVAGREAIFSRAARVGTGDKLWRFAAEARDLVGDDEVVFVETWLDPTPLMMGRHRTTEPTPDQIAEAPWVVARLLEGVPDGWPDPVLRSDEVDRVVAGSSKSKDGGYVVALFRGPIVGKQPENWPSPP
ncbi:MAG: hypothetical protein AAGI53_00650 [Planctomycetota bacterium]